MVYEILYYKKYQKRIESLLLRNLVNDNIVVKQPRLAVTRFGYDVEHYTIGHGPNHVVIMGGTHGNEIISVDFVTQLMAEMAEGAGEFADFDPGQLTVHFIPLQNPEGFIISTSSIATEMLYADPFELDHIKAGDNQLIYQDPYKTKLLNEIQRTCKNYYSAYRQDDIDAKNNENTTGIKHRHEMFPNVTPDVIADTKIKENVTNMFNKVDFPQASLIDWRSNGSGVDLNGNTPHHTKSLAVQKEGQVLMGSLRFNTIRNYVYGPLGVATLDADKFGYEPENIGLFQLLNKLYANNDYIGMLTFHGTGGAIYSKPYESYLNFTENSHSQMSYEAIAYINDKLADDYSAHTTYRKIPSGENTGVGDLIRSNYPGELLIELSKMGGNPIGPYGDVLGNYKNTMCDNMKAVASYLKKCLLLKQYMYPQTTEEKSYDGPSQFHFNK